MSTTPARGVTVTLPSFLGSVNIELSGSAAELDPRARPGAPAVLARGVEPRPEDEVSRLADRKVSVLGKLARDPSKALPPSQGASERPRPTLLEVRELKAAD